MTKIGRCLAVILAVVAVETANASPRQVIYVPAPYASAARVIRLAKHGNMNAQAQLGWMYSTGRGVPQDYYGAAKWYYGAAVQGHGWAQFELGLLYNNGRGVPRDYVLAYMWLNLSASQAAGDDRDFRARIRDAVASKMTAAQVAKAQQLALAWYKTR